MHGHHTAVLLLLTLALFVAQTSMGARGQHKRAHYMDAAGAETQNVCYNAILRAYFCRSLKHTHIRPRVRNGAHTHGRCHFVISDLPSLLLYVTRSINKRTNSSSLHLSEKADDRAKQTLRRQHPAHEHVHHSAQARLRLRGSNSPILATRRSSA